MSYRAASKKTPYRVPAAPANRPPSRKVITTTLSMLMPISAAVSGSWAVARMPLPSRELARNRSRPKVSRMAATMTSTLSRADVGPADRRQLRLLQHPREAQDLPAVADGEQLLEEQGHADGRDQRGQAGRVAAAEGTVRHPFHGHRGEPGRGHGRDRHQDEGDDQGQAHLRRVAGGDAEAVHGEQGGEHPDHEHLGVGEVDEPQDAVDQRVAQGDQRVDGAEGQAVERLRPELVDEAGEAGVDGAPRLGGGSGRGRGPGYGKSSSVVPSTLMAPFWNS